MSANSSDRTCWIRPAQSVAVSLFGRGADVVAQLNALNLSLPLGINPPKTQTQPFSLICPLGHQTDNCKLVSVKEWAKGRVQRLPCDRCYAWVPMERDLMNAGIARDAITLKGRTVCGDRQTTEATVICPSGHQTSMAVMRFLNAPHPWQCPACVKLGRQI
jgi:hypothetical protein